MKPKFNYQGKVVMEPGERPGEVLMMLPDGSVESAKDSKAALKKAKAWCEANMEEAVNAAIIEWRGGLQPPPDTKK